MLPAGLLEALGGEAGAPVGEHVRDPEREGRERLLEEGPGAGLGLVVPDRQVDRARAPVDGHEQEPLAPLAAAVRSFGRCFTSRWTKPSSYSLNLAAARSGAAAAGRRLRPAALRMR
jgi:hypothetical protein